MEHIDIKVMVKDLNEPREVLTSYGVTHNIVDGEVEDDTGDMGLTIWNEKIELISEVKRGSLIMLRNCFVTSFKGALSINIGRDSSLEIIW
jgi:ssDNA-binding replication factor A large subunit